MANSYGYIQKNENDNYRFRVPPKGTILFFAVFLFINFAVAQKPDSLRVIDNFSGNVGITHNGISLIPSFSLGEPALLINLNIGMKRFSVEPDIRFSLKGKPCTFLAWFRYKAIQHEKFSLGVGAHPALNFRTIPVVSNGVAKEVIESRRFVATEVVPRYSLAKDISIGMYYLFSYGFDDSAKITHFLTFNTAFTNINLAKKIHFGIFPQVYYLRMDEREGYYAGVSGSLTKRNFPFSLTAIVNQEIESDIISKSDFIWSVSLVYNF